MLLPDKMTRYEESVLPKFVPILQMLEEQVLSPDELYRRLCVKEKKIVSSVSEFIQTLDALYALGKITLNDKGELVCL